MRVVRQVAWTLASWWSAAAAATVLLALVAVAAVLLLALVAAALAGALAFGALVLPAVPFAGVAWLLDRGSDARRYWTKVGASACVEAVDFAMRGVDSGAYLNGMKDARKAADAVRERL